MTDTALPVVHRACSPGESGFGPWHVNAAWEITWVERGRLRFHLETQSVEARAGECVIVPPDLRNRPWVKGAALHQVWLPQQTVHAARALSGEPPPPRSAYKC